METEQVEVWVRIGERVFKGTLDASFEKAPHTGMVLNIGGDQQSPVIALTDYQVEERSSQLQDLLFQKRTTKDIYLGGSFKVILETFEGNTMLALDSVGPGIKQPQNALRKWDIDYEMVRTLAQGIQSFGGNSIGDKREDREKFVLGLGWPVILYLGQCWNDLMAELGHLLRPTVAEELLRK